MLLKTAMIIRPCAAGENLAEQIQKGFIEVTMASGQKRRDPLYTGRYVEGTPFGYVTVSEAPIDLLIDDVIEIEAEFGKPFRVTRNGKEVWIDNARVAEEKRKADKRQGAYAQQINISLADNEGKTRTITRK